MARYIDAEKILTDCIEGKKFVFKMEDLLKREAVIKTSVGDFIKLINEQPTADVVEVVRCKDCVSHTHCFIEDHYRFVGIENPFCCVGKKVE